VGEFIARPLATLKRRSKEQDFSVIAQLIREHEVETLVVGLPLNMDGSMGFQAQRTVRYAERLREALVRMSIDIELIFWDERLTTEQAREIIVAGKQSRRRRADIDAVAAAAILQCYLDGRSDRETRDNERDWEETES
jgi:putative Holliday junction resolvase